MNVDLTFTLSDGTTINKIGDTGNRLVQILRPIEDGGWGGALFHDAATDTLIASINIRKESSVGTLDRVEVSFARNTDNEWRIDFGALAAYSTTIDAGLAPNRELHFDEANKSLSTELAGDQQLVDELNLGPRERKVVDSGTGESPKPYTWHHVNGNGDIQLVDHGVHAFFNHAGGFSEWQPN